MSRRSQAITSRLVAEIALYEPQSTGGGGGGITQLTDNVLAGPGAGSVPATVVKINGATVPVAGALTPGDVLTVTGPAALAYSPPAVGGITQLTGQVTAGPGSGSQAAKVAAQQANTLYVSTAGSDISGNGNIFNPFATYNHAAAVAIAGGAAAGNFWTVLFTPGMYAQNVNIQPWVDLCGTDTTNNAAFASGAIELNGTFSLGLGFAGAGPLFSGVSNVSFGNDITLDFLTPGVTLGGVQFFNSILQNLTVLGGGLVIRCGLTSAITGNVNVQDARLDVSAAEISGNLAVTSPSFGSEVFLIVSSIDASLSIDGSDGFASTVKNLGSVVRSTVALNGANASYVTSIEGYGNTTTITGGAPLPQVYGSGSSSVGQAFLADGGGNWVIGNVATGAYSPAVPGNWAGAPPTTIQQALDRIAANTTNTHPIP